VEDRTFFLLESEHGPCSCFCLDKHQAFLNNKNMGNMTSSVINVVHETSSFMDKDVFVAIGFASAVAFLLWYEKAIRRRLRALQESTLFGEKPRNPFRMIRVSTNDSAKVSDKIKLVALDDKYTKEGWKLTSLGAYMSSLRPYLTKDNESIPDWIDEEIQAGLTAALLRSLGPHFGAALLPGLNVMHRQVEQVAGAAAGYILASRSRRKDRIMMRQSQGQDLGSLPLSLFAMTYVAELNYQRVKAQRQNDARILDGVDENEQEARKDAATSAVATTNTLQLLRREGEVAFKPTFYECRVPENLLRSGNADSGYPESSSDSSGRDEPAAAVPNPFVLSRDWNRAIASMEHLLTQLGERSEWISTSRDSQTTAGHFENGYDPHSRAMNAPSPIDERFLPDLHEGWGSALCTHAKREILQNRLLCVLLNRLSSNYFYSGCKKEPPFVVRMDETDDAEDVITKPDDLMQALIDLGHTVEVCVRTHVTTFGIALCVKEEEDNSWTNIPLAFFMQNGYSDAKGKEAFVCLPHSGLNLEIRGPLLSKGSIQHYIAIEGMCGWHSNHNADVPWIENIDCGTPVTGIDTFKSIRTAGLFAVIMNGVATKFQLPFGGYGLTGVCNDSAAVLEYALSGTTHIYPLTLNGTFVMYSLRAAKELCTKLSQDPSMSKEVLSLKRLMKALKELPSDISSLPSEAADQCRRFLHCQPQEKPFALMLQSCEVVRSVQKEVDQE
jgi:hypothetical protein